MKRIIAILVIITLLPVASVFAEASAPVSVEISSCSVEKDGSTEVGTTVHISISAVGAERVQLMVVPPDSSRIGVDGTEIDYTLDQPGVWAFTAYAQGPDGKKVHSEQWRVTVFSNNPSDVPHEHQYEVFYDKDLNEHTYCVYCEPRTEAQKEQDRINAARFHALEAAQAASDGFLLNDRASQLLFDLVKVHLDPLYSMGSDMFLLGSFSWVDLIKTKIPGSEEVNRIRKAAIQDTVQEIMQGIVIKAQGSDDWDINPEHIEEFVEEMDSLIEWLADISDDLGISVKDLRNPLKFIVKGKATKNEVMFSYGVSEIKRIKDELRSAYPALLTPEKTRFIDNFADELKGSRIGWCINILFLAVNLGIDINEYMQMSDQRKEVIDLALQRMETNIKILDDLYNTFKDNDDIASYCLETKNAIIEYANSRFWGDMCSMRIDALNILSIALQDVRDAGAEILIGSGVNAVFLSICGTAGSVVTIAGAGLGFLAELIWGTHTGYMNYDYITNLYIDMAFFVHNYRPKVSSWSDYAKAFASIYMIELKIAGLEMAKKIYEKGDYSSMIELYNSTISILEESMEKILSGYIP